MLRVTGARDPRGYILSADQPDFPTATKFVNALIKAGITVQRATRAFDVGGKRYPAGSYVVKTAQAFRPHVMDMFEPQNHPNDFPYPGGPPRPPYDVTGYNLAYSMGVAFDRVLEGFEGPFAPLPDVVPPPAVPVGAAPPDGGYVISPRVNDAFVAVNRLLKANEEVYRVAAEFAVGGRTYPAGSFFVRARPSTLGILRALATEKGVASDPIAAAPRASSPGAA